MPTSYAGLGLNCLFELVQQAVPELRLLESVDSHYTFFFFSHWIVINMSSKDEKMQSEKNKPDQQVVNTFTE